MRIIIRAINTPGVHEYLTNGCILNELVNLHIEERENS